VISGFVAVFVAANTFAISILQRTREIALLRAIGATTGQVRRLLVGESLSVTIVASVIGCVAGALVAAALAPLFARSGLAPSGFQATATPLPLAAALGGGIVVGLLAVLAAAWRVARIRPVEALLSAAVEAPRVAPMRLVFGLAASALGLLVMLRIPPNSGLNSALEVVVAALILSVGAALLGPMLARPGGWVLGAILARLARVTGQLAQANTVANPRRTASAAAPLMLTVTLACTLLFGAATIAKIQLDRTTQSLHAQYLVVAGAGPGLPPSVSDAVAQVPGVGAAVGVVSTSIVLAAPSNEGPAEDQSAFGVEPAHLTDVLDFGVQQGSLGDLQGDTVAIRARVATQHGWKLGDAVPAWFADGTATSLRMVAVFSDSSPDASALLPRALAAQHASQGLDQTVYVTVAPGADQSRVEGGLRGLSQQYPTLQVVPRSAYLAQLSNPTFDQQLPLYVLTGLVVIYTAIAIANTLIMATAERSREFALLRLVGTTRAQVVGMIGWEAAIVVLMGVLLGTIISAVALLQLSRTLAGTVDVALQPAVYAAIVLSCAVLGFAASLLPARLALQARPIHAIGTRE
jgi:putative ABC transport system permease protein